MPCEEYVIVMSDSLRVLAINSSSPGGVLLNPKGKLYASTQGGWVGNTWPLARSFVQPSRASRTIMSRSVAESMPRAVAASSTEASSAESMGAVLSGVGSSAAG